MLTTIRLTGLAIAAAALLAPAAPATAAPEGITIGLENGCEPVTGACTIVNGDWGVKVVRDDPNCPSPSGTSTGIYVGRGSWVWVACIT